MIKFVLHWWVTTVEVESNKRFFQTALESLSHKWKILLVPFASQKVDWEKVADIDINKFKKYGDISNINFEIASDEIDVLKKQIEWADLLYLRGWHTLWLLDIMKKIDNIKDIIENKIICWTSAGALIWWKYFFTQEKDWVFNGLGLLNIKIITHYSDDRERNNIERLKNYWENLETIWIKEQEFIEFILE